MLTEQRLRNYFLFLLSKRDYSAHSLRQKAKLKKYESNIIESVITDFIDKNYIREDAYTKSKTLSWHKKGMSLSMIQRKLGLEKLQYSDDQLKEWLSEDGREEHDMTDSLIFKKMKNIDYTTLSGDERLKIKGKTLRYLLSKGHSYDQAKGAIERYIRSSDQY